MVFASPIFLFAFLPVLLLAYYLLRPRNLVLLAASLLFYAWGEPVYVFLMLAGIAVNYLMALAIEKRRSRVLLVLAVLLDLGMLAVFKYADLLIESVNFLFRANLPLAHLALPLGISFYTFQILSYVIDVWRGNVKAEKNPLLFGAYVSMFPQLIAGPIVRYQDVAASLRGQSLSTPAPARLSLSEVGDGARRFCLGLAKKVLLSNVLSECADMAFTLGGSALSAPAAWMGAICYTLQIYFDFSGYSDMAIGLGHMLGFRFPENFNHPYISASVREFWRRWHITLSTWFRDYLYIPLGGSRRGTARTCLNLLIVFALCGLWHGASWSFVVWGLYHGVFLALERLPLLRRKRPRLVGLPVTLLIVVVGWVIFRADTLAQAWEYIRALFGQGGTVSVSAISGVKVWAAAAIGAVGCTPWLSALKERMARLSRGQGIIELLSVLLSAALLAVCAAMLAGGTYNPFIYFRF